jgi:hypothetical protein
MRTRYSGLVVCCLFAVQGCNCGVDPTEDAGLTQLRATPKEVSDFASGADGWIITGDAQNSSVKPGFSADAGNPGGTISAKDNVAGGVWYFVAPSRYLGDNGEIVGKWLKFDLRVDATPAKPFSNIDVKLVGNGGVVLAYDTPNDPVGDRWTTYAVPLKAEGWKVGSLTGVAATEAQFEGVMHALTALWIRGEFNSGADTGYLDNVLWGVE